MICIFCKSDSSNSKGLEHIIPESLGNKEHILPVGIVCDKCNNYFARKIEKGLLERPYFRNLRHENAIESKKGRIPTQEGYLSTTPIEIHRVKDGFEVYINNKDEDVIEKILAGKINTLILPTFNKPEKNDRTVSRFLGKVGIEILAAMALDTENAIDEIIYKKELDRLRGYVRYGRGPKLWPYHQRRIYEENEILHEYKLFYTPKMELHVVVAIMGIEYCLNMGEPNVEGYLEWLKENKNKSPLDKKFCRG